MRVVDFFVFFFETGHWYIYLYSYLEECEGAGAICMVAIHLHCFDSVAIIIINIQSFIHAHYPYG